jgi:demethylmenaquinone methyltransferase/2-methoxy-6-polyprenyl-1,4-benzoquinol methylase
MIVDKSHRRVRSMFAEIADRYDLMNHLLSANVDRYWRRAMVHRLGAETNDPILDVCTGTGDLALAFWKAHGGRVPVVGVDFCRPMLRHARRKKLRRQVGDTLQFVEADALSLPLADNGFQRVVVAFGLRNLADPRQGLREMWRVCRPGGKLGVLEFSLPQRQPLRSLYTAYFRHVLPRIGQVLARNRQSAYQYLPQSVGEFPAGEKLVEWLKECGWRDAGFQPLSMGIATLYTAVK